MNEIMFSNNQLRWKIEAERKDHFPLILTSDEQINNKIKEQKNGQIVLFIKGNTLPSRNLN